jgi:Na+-driven multidrug efflux pump
MDFTLIPYWGMIGAAVASSISYTISAAVAVYFFKCESGYSIYRILLLTRKDLELAFKIMKSMWYSLNSK